jgi:hypothetical protein
VNFIKNYPLVYLLLTPAFFPVVTPITIIPAAMITALIAPNDYCVGQGSMCALGLGLSVMIILNVLVAYSMGVVLYKVINKPTNLQLIITSTILGLYFVLIFGGGYLYDSQKRIAQADELRKVHLEESNLTPASFEIIEYAYPKKVSTWLQYDTKNGIVWHYPPEFNLEDHQAPSSYYFRTSDSRYDADSLIVANNGRFIGLDKISYFDGRAVSSDHDAVDTLMLISNSQNVSEMHPKVSKRTIYKGTNNDGAIIYFLEKGEFNKIDQRYNSMYALINLGDSYYTVQTYTTFYEGNKIARSIIGNSIYSQ